MWSNRPVQSTSITFVLQRMHCLYFAEFTFWKIHMQLCINCRLLLNLPTSGKPFALATLITLMAWRSLATGMRGKSTSIAPMPNKKKNKKILVKSWRFRVNAIAYLRRSCVPNNRCQLTTWHCATSAKHQSQTPKIHVTQPRRWICGAISYEICLTFSL